MPSPVKNTVVPGAAVYKV